MLNLETLCQGHLLFPKNLRIKTQLWNGLQQVSAKLNDEGLTIVHPDTLNISAQRATKAKPQRAAVVLWGAVMPFGVDKGWFSNGG